MMKIKMLQYIDNDKSKIEIIESFQVLGLGISI